VGEKKKTWGTLKKTTGVGWKKSRNEKGGDVKKGVKKGKK